MTDPLATLPDLLARLEAAPEPMSIAPMGTVYELPRWRDEWKRERAECLTAIRTLMAERKAAYEAGWNDAAEKAVRIAARFVSSSGLGCRMSEDVGHPECAAPPAIAAEINTMWLEREVPSHLDLVPRSNVDRAVRAEREACAKVCDDMSIKMRNKGAHEMEIGCIACASAIRARGESAQPGSARDA